MSTDDTVEIIKSELTWIVISYNILYDKRRGLSYARQMVLKNSAGKYVIWIDGDNYIPSHFIKRQVSSMEQNPEVGAQGALMIPKGDSIVARLQGYQWLIPAIDKTLKRKEDEKKEIPLLGMMGVICRLKALEEVDGFDLKIRGAGEDSDLFIKMQKKLGCKG